MGEFAAEHLRTTVEGASNLLLVTPRPHAVDDEACVGLMQDGRVADAHVLMITYTQSATARLAAWDEYSGTRPAETAVIDVGQITRPSPPGGGPTHPPGVTVETVADAGDLTGLGVAITNHLDEWGAGADVRICFHSVTALLQYVGLEQAARFLEVLTDRVETSDAVAHYHVQADAHDERTLETLTPFFDAVATVTAGGDWRIQCGP